MRELTYLFDNFLVGPVTKKQRGDVLKLPLAFIDGGSSTTQSELNFKIFEIVS